MLGRSVIDARSGWAVWDSCPFLSRNLKIMTSCTVFVGATLKFLFAPLSLAHITQPKTAAEIFVYIKGAMKD